MYPCTTLYKFLPLPHGIPIVPKWDRQTTTSEAIATQKLVTKLNLVTRYANQKFLNGLVAVFGWFSHFLSKDLSEERNFLLIAHFFE